MMMFVPLLHGTGCFLQALYGLIGYAGYFFRRLIRNQCHGPGNRPFFPYEQRYDS